MKKTSFAIAFGLLTSACTAPVPTLEVTRAPTTASLQSSVSQDRLTGKTQEILIRTRQTQGETVAEVGNIECEITSDELSGRIVTPQAITVPTFKQRRALENRGLPSALVVDCSGQGLSGRSLITPAEKQTTTVGGLGLIGALVSTAASAAIATGTPWAFPEQASVAVNAPQ